MPDIFGLLTIVAGALILVFSRRMGEGKAKEQRMLTATLFGMKSKQQYRRSAFSGNYYRVSYILFGLGLMIYGVARQFWDFSGDK